MGFKEYPTPPMEGMLALKEMIRSQSPNYQCNPTGLDTVWKEREDLINDARSKIKKQPLLSYT